LLARTFLLLLLLPLADFFLYTQPHLIALQMVVRNWVLATSAANGGKTGAGK